MQSKLDVLSLSGPGFVSRELFAYLEGNPNSNLVVLPKEYFYPVSNKRRGELKPYNYLDLVKESIGAKSVAYGCHMWEASWTTPTTSK